jgi:hypothetical protein
MELTYPLKNGIYWEHNGKPKKKINEWDISYIAIHHTRVAIEQTKGLILPSFYLELKSNGRGTTKASGSVFIHSSRLTKSKSTNNLTIFEFKPNHVNEHKFKQFQTEKSLSEINLCSSTVPRTFGISNEVFGMVIDAARVGKGITFNKQLNEWEPGSMLYRD